MKRVMSGCILQTLIFSQNPDKGYSHDQSLKNNKLEIEAYTKTMDRSKIRYQIVSEEEQPDGSIIVHVKKQYNEKADVSEYFN